MKFSFLLLISVVSFEASAASYKCTLMTNHARESVRFSFDGVSRAIQKLNGVNASISTLEAGDKLRVFASIGKDNGSGASGYFEMGTDLVYLNLWVDNTVHEVGCSLDVK